MRPTSPATRGAAFLRVHPRAACAVAVVVLLALAIGSATGAGSSVVVTMDVASTTSLSATGCAPGTAGVTEFGVVQPGASAVTTADCVLTWGSSNDTSMLRAYQSDGTGTAMGAPDAAWTARTTRDQRSHQAIDAASATVAFAAVGGAGFSATTNGGDTWVDRSAVGTVYDVSAIPGSTTTAVGVTSAGNIYRTVDNGGAWTLETSGVTSALVSVSMADASNGFAVGNGGVVRRRTTAGGATWAAATSPVAANLTAVSAASTTVAFVVSGGGRAYRTEDGGSSWSSTASTCNGNYGDVRAIDANTAYAAGTGGGITRITWNAGTSTLACTAVATGLGEDLTAIAAAGSVLYASGVLGTLIRSTDSGATWTRMDPRTAATLAGLSTPADGSIWVAGSSGTVARAPTGTSFAIKRAYSADSTTLTDVAAISARTAYVVGGQVDRGATWEAAIRRTTDGGATWTSLTSSTQRALFGVTANHDGTTIIAVGEDGTIVRSTNSGASWSAQSVTPGVRLWDVDLSDRFRGWAVGENGTILRTTNAGQSWTAQASPAPATTGLRAVAAVDENVAFAVGVAGRVLRTTNGGTTWTALGGIPTSQPLDDVSAASADAVWIAWGWQGVLHTTNGTAATPTWTSVVTGSGQDALAIDAVSPSAAFVGSSWGSASRTRSSGSAWESSALPGVGGAFMFGVDAVDENSAWVVGGENLAYLTRESTATAFGDYADAGPNWSSGGSMFGACLRQLSGTSTVATWTPDATCAASGTGVWRGLPATSDLAGAKVAGATAVTTATARLRFGLRVAPAQPPGRYSAGVAFEVVAPNA